jgi:hypothetical protein
MNRQALRYFLPAILLFIVLNMSFFVLINRFENWGFDTMVLAVGNVVLFGITFISYLMCVKALYAKNNHVFFRLVYGSFIIKLLLLALAAFIYIMTVKKQVNKPALFLCMGLYLVYTFIEVSGLMKFTRPKKPVSS